MNFLFLDTETTGFADPRMISVAFNIHGTTLINHGYYKPPKPVEEGATKANGITTEMLKDEAVFAGSKDALHLQQLLDKLVLVCHNVKFDAAVLRNEGLQPRQTLCTLEMARMVYPNLLRFNLPALKDELNLGNPFSVAHSAVGDVITLKKLFRRICEDQTKSFGGDIKRMQAYVSSFISGKPV